VTALPVSVPGKIGGCTGVAFYRGIIREEEEGSGRQVRGGAAEERERCGGVRRARGGKGGRGESYV
jgi:hypothetical protein